jgi:hypothetical protein
MLRAVDEVMMGFSDGHTDQVSNYMLMRLIEEASKLLTKREQDRLLNPRYVRGE